MLWRSYGHYASGKRARVAQVHAISTSPSRSIGPCPRTNPAPTSSSSLARSVVMPGVLGDRNRHAVAEALRRLALVLESGAGAGNRRCDETEPSTAGCGSSPVSQS